MKKKMKVVIQDIIILVKPLFDCNRIVALKQK